MFYDIGLVYFVQEKCLGTLTSVPDNGKVPRHARRIVPNRLCRLCVHRNKHVLYLLGYQKKSWLSSKYTCFLQLKFKYSKMPL